MIYGLIFIVAALAFALYLSTFENKSSDKDWDAYLSNETSQTAQILSRAARPLASLPALQKQLQATQTYRHLETKLRSGGAYGGSLEIYLSIQILAIIFSMSVMAGLLITGLDGFWFFVGSAIALIVILIPYNNVRTAAKERTTAVTESLPDFAELLGMVIPSMSILAALAFTAERTDGPVSEEVTSMVSSIASRTLSETEAFQLAADRLGTPQARSFMTTLMNAYLEGQKALDAINAQAETMRKISFQNKRAAAKALPTKLIFIFGLHFMPSLFIIALLPLGLSIGSIAAP